MKNWIIDIALIILIIALGGFIYFQLDRLIDSPDQDMPQVNETVLSPVASQTVTPSVVFNYSRSQKVQAPDFTLTKLDGERVNLSDFFGHPVMINFWATWCPPCKAEMPIIQGLLEDSQDGFVVLAVNVGESEDVVRGFAEENEFDFTFLPDPSNSTANTYGISGYPTSVFIDKEGLLQGFHIGELNKELLSTYLLEIGVGE